MNNKIDETAEGTKMIPGVAKVVAVLLFLCMFVVILRVMPKETNPPPFPLQVLFGVLGGTVLAAFALLAGYVFRDAKRRGMNHVGWTLIAIFVPNGIGFILYFLLRQPIMRRCPQCSETVRPEFNYCPRCNLQLNPICASCGKTARFGDKFCPYCGQTLAVQSPPMQAPPPLAPPPQLR
jgi:hypothetical protein